MNGDQKGGRSVTAMESLQERILQERQQRQVSSERDPMALIKAGRVQVAVENLVFFVSPADFCLFVETLREEIKAKFDAMDRDHQERCLCFLVDLVLGLDSFLPQWNLQNRDRHGENALTNAQVEAETIDTMRLVAGLAARAPTVAEKLLAERRAEAVARLQAESHPDPEGGARALAGNSIDEYLAHVRAELNKSHLRRIADMRVAGQTLTELSNDYAAFLQYALYLGASFVTCNPPLVDLAWLADRDRWNPVVDGIITDNPEASDDELARLVTLEVVLANMRLLRPIFLLTEGQMGCVCLQVNPHDHGDAPAMIADALFIYDRLQAKLGGGVPNIVFKLPGTKAGLQACRVLTGRGIGVTITVDFGMFQHLPFAQAMHDGVAIYSNLVEMNGRLAYPVRDEMLSKLDELATHGIDEAQAREAAAWSGVAVMKRLYELLNDRGYDLLRIKPLVASLRIYEGDGYQDLPSAFPDITEILGTSILSVFPNVRRAFDAQPQIELQPRQIESPVSDDILETLTHSEIFKQAYYVADGDWLPEGDGRFRPAVELTLEDEAATAAWPPVHNTLTQFCDSYDSFVQQILERKRLLRMGR